MSYFLQVFDFESIPKNPGLTLPIFNWPVSLEYPGACGFLLDKFLNTCCSF